MLHFIIELIHVPLDFTTLNKPGIRVLPKRHVYKQQATQSSPAQLRGKINVRGWKPDAIGQPVRS